MKIKANITVIRETEYLLCVEMDKTKFDRLKKDLESGERQARRSAERELNSMVKPEHWANDDLSRIDEFEEIAGL